ncbi:MAG TPA: oxidoreductase [Chloroflexi bacterium]|nr:oxidoreductase [Chloroflexota bacterium]HHW86337.1 Gfo/Idh/MocA family oxidoreductase [Chloroflexota bacterium]
MESKPVAVGVIGCGNISGAYMRMLKTLPIVQVTACADLRMEAAQALAAQYDVPRVLSVPALLADPDIEIVLNLTTPQGHGEIALAALTAGKSVYNEKPLALTREEGRQMLALAAAKGLRVGGAPDTFLGGGLQTCRELIDAGAIGTPVAATAFMMSRGHEHWHPNPAFYYQMGGGPMFDMGPYYLTALVSLLGPVQRVTGATRITRAQRTITSQPHYGEIINVEVPTHVTGLLDFAAGPIGTIITTFDVQASTLPWIEIYGTTGTLAVPDPNTFGGPVRLRMTGDNAWQEIPVTRPYTENSRGLGLADMAEGLRSGRPHRANGDLAYHVLDIMHAIHDASATGHHVQLESTCARPEAMPA